jgi:hypothetical protein
MIIITIAIKMGKRIRKNNLNFFKILKVAQVAQKKVNMKKSHAKFKKVQSNI